MAVKKINHNSDEIDILELLDLTSEDILDRFEDVVEDKYEMLRKEI